MSTPTLGSHEVLLADGSTTLGFFFLRDKDKKPVLSEAFAESLSQQQYTELSEAAFPSSEQAIHVETDWSKGFGVQNFTIKRYQQSFGVDASFPGILVPGPVGVATTKTTPSYATTTSITNGGFESGALTPWAVVVEAAEVAFAVQAGTVRTGIKALKAQSNAGGATIKNQLVSADSSLFGDASTPVQITVSVYGRRAAGGTGTLQLILKDASGTVLQTGAATALNDAGWTEVTVSHTFTESWPHLVVHMVVGAESVECYMDDCTVTITAGVIQTTADMGTIIKLIDFNANHYAVSNTGVWKRTADNWARVAGSPDSITDAMSDGTYLFLCRGTSKNYWYMSSAEAFTRNTGTGASSKVNKMVWAGGFMWGCLDQSTVYKYSNLDSGTVASTLTVGETGYNITHLLNHDALCHVFTENQHDYISATPATIANVTPQLRSLYNTNTGKNAQSWNGNVYIPAGAQAIIEYDDGTIDSVGPSTKAERLPDFSGQVVALAGDDEWLYAIVDNSTKVEILKGRTQVIDGESVLVWHPFYEDTYGTVTYSHISSITAKRLYYGGGTDLPKYIPLPTKYADPLTDTALSFLTGTTFETGWITFGLSNVNKSLLSFVLESSGLSTGHRTVNVAFKKWGDANWTTLGTSDGFITSPSQEVFFPTGTNTITTKKIRFQFTLKTDNSATGLGILQFTVNAVINPPRLRTFALSVVVGDGNTEKSGNIDNEMTYAAVASTLMGWASTYPLTLTMPDTGTSYYVKFQEGYPKKRFTGIGQSEAQLSASAVFDMLMIAPRTS